MDKRMKTARQILFFCLAATVSSGAAAAFSDCRCVIKELIRVHSPQEFSCRVDRFAGIKNLKLRITIRDVEVPQDAERIRELEKKLGDLLSRTEVIEMKNIRDRGYFRLLADVWADGINIKEYLQNSETVDPSTQAENDTMTTNFVAK